MERKYYAHSLEGKPPSERQPLAVLPCPDVAAFWEEK